MRKSMGGLVSKMIESTHNLHGKKLAACLLRGCTKPVGAIYNNHDRNYFHGKVCSSAHAEGTAIISHYGENLTYMERSGWMLKRKAGY
jgi:hypothetical protein